MPRSFHGCFRSMFSISAAIHPRMANRVMHAPDTKAGPDRPVMTPKAYNARLAANEADNSRLENIGLLLRGAVCGALGCLTCFCCCFGCCGKMRNHSGMVKYDDPEFTAMPPDQQSVVVVEEHANAMMLCVPHACVSCWCCLGACGLCGPRLVGMTVACSVQGSH